MSIFFSLIAIIIVAAIVIVGAFALVKLLQLIFPNAFNTSSTLGKNWTDWFKNSVVPKFVIVGILTIMMLLPFEALREVVSERHGHYRDVLQDISKTWGGPQQVYGPMLVIPFVETYTSMETIKDKEGNEKQISRTYEKDKNFVILPEQLNIDYQLQDDFRQRGIYKSLVYTSDIQLTGNFEIPALTPLSKHIKTILYDKAYLAVRLSDIQAINEIAPVEWNGQSYRFDSGLQIPIGYGSSAYPRSSSSRSKYDSAVYNAAEAAIESVSSNNSSPKIPPGFHAKLSGITENQKATFTVKLNVNGSYGLRFAPFGRVTDVTMKSTWPHPSFQGSVLPNSHDISDQGFTAEWHIPSIARNYPQSFILEDTAVDIGEFQAGVDLVETVSLYSKVTRAVKYGILFIGLTFLTFLIFEIGAARKRLHIVQYALIGGVLALFYLCLLSLSEHMLFLQSYMISAAVSILIIVLYTWAATRSFFRASLILTLLSALYAVLYALLNLEDYALLVGTGLLLVVIVVLMYITRHINQTSATQPASQETSQTETQQL